MQVGGQRPGLGLFTPGEEIRYPLYRRLGGPQGRSGPVRKISPPPGIDTRTVELVASRYTYWAIATHLVHDIKFLAPDFFLILAHPVYKMWIIQEPNTLELWNKLHFEGEKTDSIYRVWNIQYF